MSPERRLSALAGALYLVTFATSIPALALKSPILADGANPLVAGSDGALAASALLELLNAFACVGTALALLPLLRRDHPVGGFGFTASRALEAAVILVGVAALVALINLRSDTGTGTSGGDVLVNLNEAAFLVGPGLLPAVNAGFLATVLYRARLAPRAIPAIGLLGAPLLVGSALATMFGIHAQTSATAATLAVPIALWEFSLGIQLLFRGLPRSNQPGHATSVD